MNMKNLLTQIGFALLLITLSGVSYSQKKEDFDIHNYPAGKGCPSAVFLWSSGYCQGKDIPQDYAEAFKWLLFSSTNNPGVESELAQAQYNRKVMYNNGQGVPKNNAEAVKWYRLAANEGNAIAQYNIGIMYAKGDGIPQNYSEAVKWYRLAARQGYASAQSNIGAMYFNGEGVSQNNIRAYMWWSVSAAQGNKIARGNRDRISDKLTRGQLARGQKMAGRCFDSDYQNCD